jgi:hypothetical protein
MPCFDFFWNAWRTYTQSARRTALDSAKRVASVVRDHLHAARAQPLQWLGRDVLPAALRQEQSVADLILNTCRERPQDAK